MIGEKKAAANSGTGTRSPSRPSSGSGGSVTPVQGQSSRSSSPRLSVQEADVLDGWLTRLERLPGALPSKASLPQSPPTSPRPNSARSTASSSEFGTVTAGNPRPQSATWYQQPAIDEEAQYLDSPVTPSSTRSSREASPRPSSSLEPSWPYTQLLSGTKLRRHRSKSLSDKPDAEYHDSDRANSARPRTAASIDAHKRKAVPITWSSSPLSGSSSGTFSRTALAAQRLQQQDYSYDFGPRGSISTFASRKLKRRSVPSALPIVFSRPRSGKDRRIDKEGERETTDSETEVSGTEGDTTVAEEEGEQEGDSFLDVEQILILDRSKTPTQFPSELSPAFRERSIKKKRRMTSPLTSPAFDTHSSRSSGSGSIASGGGRPGTSSSSRYQPRSPFASQGCPEWRKRHFPRQVSGQVQDSDEDDGNDVPHGVRGSDEQGRRREVMTVTQALAEMGREDPMDPSSRLRKDSRGSLASAGSSSLGRQGSSNSRDRSNSRDPRRESIDSRASSNHSLKLFGRTSNKHPQLPPQSALSQNPAPSFQSSSPSTSSNYSTQQSQALQQARKPRLEARDDRVRPVRPRFGSTRSASSLPLHDEDTTSRSSPGLGRDSDDEENLPNSRRASIPNASQLYASASSARAIRASLAVPPAFNRSYSYDDTRLAAQTTSSSAAADSASDPPHTRDMAQAVLLWVPDESAPSTSKSGHGRNLTKVLLGNVPRKKVTKRDSAQVLGSSAMVEDRTTGKGKERAKDRLPSVVPPGQWKQCEAVLKPTGQLSLFSEYVYLTSISVSSLQRTDIRPADPSLLLRQRVLGLHLHNTAFAPLPFGGPQTATASNFPTSPSAPEFGSFTASTSYTNLTGRPSTAKSTKGILERDADKPQTLYLAFPSVATLQTWITALQNHARPEIYPSSARLDNQLGMSLEEELSSSGADDSGVTGSPGSPQARRPRQRQGTGSWRHADESPNYPIRLYRSVSLQIIELRGPREHISSSAASVSNLAALAGMSSSNSSATLTHPHNPILEFKRTASIASGSAASTEGSEESSSVHSPATMATSSSMSPSLASVSNLSAIAGLSHPPQLKKGSGDSKRDKDGDKDREKKKEESEQVYCEVCLDSEVIARTAVKKATTAAIWQETFSFPNLPTYSQPLTVNIYSLQRSHQTLAGRVEIPLKTAKKNSKIQEWWPVKGAERTSSACTETVGEMNLGVKVREDVTLPSEAYAELDKLLTDDLGADCLISLTDAYPQLSLEDIASLLLRIDLAHNRVLPRLTAMCEREVQDGDAAILFRGNTLFTKSVELYMRIVGADFLEGAVGKVVRRLCDERAELEIDPSKVQGRERIAENVRELERWTSAIWESIYNSRHQCPSDLRRLFRQIQHIAERYFTDEHEAGRLGHLHDSERAKVKFTSISAFISLRFFGPAILNPRLFGLSSSYPADSRCQRTLTLIAKVLQGLANMSSFGAKEPWMVVMNPFLQANLSSFEDFIAHLCGKPESAREEWTSKEFELYSTPLASRHQLSPDIVREGVPNLPFLVDLPRELSVLASVVAGSQHGESRMTRRRGSEAESVVDRPHNGLVELCTKIESKTRARLRSLERMGELAGSGRAGNSHRMLVARPEGTARANSTRTRGTTISAKSHYPSSIQSNTPPRSTTLYSSSPASNTSLSPEADSLSSLVRPLDFSNRTKRRSHTISGAASTHASSGPASVTSPSISSSSISTPSPLNTPARPLPLRSSSNNTGLPNTNDSDILEIHLPTRYAGQPDPDSKTGSYRRTTISARPKITGQFSHSTEITSSVPLPEPKTPRAIPSTGAGGGNFAEMQQQPLPKRTGGIEDEIAAQEEAEGVPTKVKKGFFGRRK